MRVSDQPEIVDIRGLDTGEAGAIRRVASAIAVPCSEWGLFHVVGHGIPVAELSRFERAMRELFELPAAEKQAMLEAPDLKQRAEILIAATEIELAKGKSEEEPPVQ